MELNLSLHDLRSTISETTYDSDSTASNSIVEDIMCNKLDENKRNPSNNINTVAISGSSNIQMGDRVIYNGPVTIRQEYSGKSNDFMDVNLKFAAKSQSKNIPKSYNKQKIITVISSLLFCVVLISIFMLSLSYRVNNKIKAPTTQSISSDPLEFKLYNRSDWGAAQPDGRVDPFVLPLSRVIVCHTVTKNCFTKVWKLSVTSKKKKIEINHYRNFAFKI